MSARKQTRKNRNRAVISYASLAKAAKPVADNTNDTKTVDEHDESTNTVANSRRRCVRNTVPRRGNSSHHSWERAYFRHLINIRNILINGMVKIEPDGDKKCLRTPDFLNNLSRFLHEVSSKEISPYLDELTDREEEDYITYLTYKDST